MPILNRRVAKSPRHLALRHARRVFGASRAANTEKEVPVVGPGEEQLYSFYIPGLVAGTYDILAEQTVKLASRGQTPLKLTGSQSFTVVAPQFALPPGAIQSKYPPDGHADLVETLPHVVLTDPHLPWERLGIQEKQPDDDVNRTPWLAVLVFTPEELQLTADSPVKLSGNLKQTDTMTVNATLKQLNGFNCEKTLPQKLRNENPDQVADFIFLKAPLFNELTKEYDPAVTEAQTKCSVSRYKWLAHVRNINTTGMADSGEFEDQVGVFSIVLSHRVGPMDNKVPKPVIAHLVSIEYLADMKWPIAEDRLITLTSLHSWTYMSLPADSFSVGEAMEHLGQTLDMLRPPQTTIDRLMTDDKTKWLAQRLNDGYTLVKYRTSTGEISAALYRGPYSPTIVEYKLKPMSFFGTELQVMDKQTGIMDITYSIAWHVGRTQALGDQAFVAALGRLRTALLREGVKRSQHQAMREDGKQGVIVLKDALTALRQGLPKLNTLTTPQVKLRSPGLAVRWARDAAEPLDVSFASAAVSSRFKGAVGAAMTEFSLSTDGKIYNELNPHTFPDWPIVMSWVLDRMYLWNLPSHYFVPDPSHLPRESLRFFHIDRNWVNAMIDGGLSVGNQMQNLQDTARGCIKDAIEKYLQTPLGEGNHAYLPQVPTHGFLLRSELITKYPDLIVEAPYPDSTSQTDRLKKPVTILRQENLDSSVLLSLFDREPGGADFKQLILRQPPHQQSFAAAYRLVPATDSDPTKINLHFRRVYTEPSTDDPIQRQEPLEPDNNPIPSTDPIAPFIWGPSNSVRTLKFPQYATMAYDILTTKMSKDRFDPTKQPKPSSALIGIQLNNPMLFLEIRDKPRPKSDFNVNIGTRTLGMRDPAFPPILPPAQIPQIRLAKDLFDLTAPLPLPSSRTGDPNNLQPAPIPHPRLLPILTDKEFTHLTTIPESESPIRARGGGGPAGYPEITYQCYGFGKHARETVTVPMYPNPPPLRQDLIFSIQVDPKNVAQFELEEISILLRLGRMDLPRKTLAFEYDGPGARMLSNLRFNVIPVTDKDGNLLLRLLPRSTTGSVPMTSIVELSFVLNGIVVNRFPDNKLTNGTYKVYPVIMEKYVSRKPRKIDDESDNPFIITVKKVVGNEYDDDN